MRRIIIINFLIITVLASMPALETKEGFIRLLLNEKNGSFSFFYLGGSQSGYKPLLSRHNTPTSYLTVNVNGRSYQLGKSGVFNTRIEKKDDSPEITYESTSLLIKQLITPVKTANSSDINGIKITVNIENKSRQKTSVGLRMLFDTHLGEGRKKIPFVTGNMEITAETIIRSASGENYWISRGDGLSLMGNITNPFNENSKQPDYLHFANWKKLNDVPWSAPYFQGNSFNNIPYSIRDSAVCYYYEPEDLAGGESFQYIVYLTAEDVDWYSGLKKITETKTIIETEVITHDTELPVINIAEKEENSIIKAAVNSKDTDILTLMKLHEIITQFLAGDILLNEQDLLEIEMSINRFSVNR